METVNANSMKEGFVSGVTKGLKNRSNVIFSVSVGTIVGLAGKSFLFGFNSSLSNYGLLLISNGIDGILANLEEK